MIFAMNEKFEVMNVLECERAFLKEKQRENWFCLACHEKVQLRVGTVVSPYFAHQKQSQCEVFSENESPTHLALKTLFYNWAKDNGLKAELEAYLPELHQRPDVLIEGRIALEIQCSEISLERFTERTENYKAHGYQPFWLLGPKFKVRKCTQQSMKKFLSFHELSGFSFFSLNAKDERLILYYAIFETVCGKIVSKQVEFLIGEGMLLEILNRPNVLCGGEITFDSKTILREVHNKRMKKLRAGDKFMRSVQQHLYQKNLHLLSLPKYYYYPPVKPLFMKQDDFSWKQVLFSQLEEGSTAEACEKALLSSRLECFSFPLIHFEEVVREFIRLEILGLDTINCLEVQGDQFKLIPHQTKHLIPYDFAWEEVPDFSIKLPHNALFNEG
ncbi:MAG: hypothetical protein LBD38_02125 [Streptococcaceae bacterium]|jgi:competence protein CoiA|nr:hypothetical protein [Streptococcaceae bacterium]